MAAPGFSLGSMVRPQLFRTASLVINISFCGRPRSVRDILYPLGFLWVAQFNDRIWVFRSQTFVSSSPATMVESCGECSAGGNRRNERGTYNEQIQMMEVRTAARLLLLDANRRVLLFRHVDGKGREFWATPGGGLEPGETAEEAARREAAEELGAATVELAALWTGHSNFTFAGRNVSQTETFFLITQHSEVLGPEVNEFHRREGIAEVRWWSVEEIEDSQELVFPEDLANRLKEHFAK